MSQPHKDASVFFTLDCRLWPAVYVSNVTLLASHLSVRLTVLVCLAPDNSCHLYEMNAVKDKTSLTHLFSLCRSLPTVCTVYGCFIYVFQKENTAVQLLPLCVFICIEFVYFKHHCMWALPSSQCLQSGRVVPPCCGGFGMSLSRACQERLGSSGPGCLLLGDMRQMCWCLLGHAVKVWGLQVVERTNNEDFSLLFFC